MQLQHHNGEMFSMHLSRREFIDLVYLMRGGVSDGCPPFSAQEILDFADKTIGWENS